MFYAEMEEEIAKDLKRAKGESSSRTLRPAKRHGMRCRPTAAPVSSSPADVVMENGRDIQDVALAGKRGVKRKADTTTLSPAPEEDEVGELAKMIHHHTHNIIGARNPGETQLALSIIIPDFHVACNEAFSVQSAMVTSDDVDWPATRGTWYSTVSLPAEPDIADKDKGIDLKFMRARASVGSFDVHIRTRLDYGRVQKDLSHTYQSRASATRTTVVLHDHTYDSPAVAAQTTIGWRDRVPLSHLFTPQFLAHPLAHPLAIHAVVKVTLNQPVSIHPSLIDNFRDLFLRRTSEIGGGDVTLQSSTGTTHPAHRSVLTAAQTYAVPGLTTWLADFLLTEIRPNEVVVMRHQLATDFQLAPLKAACLDFMHFSATLTDGLAYLEVAERSADQVLKARCLNLVKAKLNEENILTTGGNQLFRGICGRWFGIS